MGTDPEQALRIKAAEVSAWMLAGHGGVFTAPLYPCAWPVPPQPAGMLRSSCALQDRPTRAMGTVLLAAVEAGRTGHCHCAPAAGRTLARCLFPLWIKVSCRNGQLLQSVSVQGGGITSTPLTGRESEAGSTAMRCSKERLEARRTPCPWVWLGTEQHTPTLPAHDTEVTPG